MISVGNQYVHSNKIIENILIGYGLSLQRGKFVNPPTHSHWGLSTQAAWDKSAQLTCRVTVGAGQELEETVKERVSE